MSEEAKIFKGIGASNGIVIGKVYLIDGQRFEIGRIDGLSDDEVKNEITRFKDALQASKEQLKSVKKKLSRDGKRKEHIGIIDAHLLILKDRMLTTDTINIIKTESVNAEWALDRVLKDVTALFHDIDDEYFRDRSSDIAHIVNRVMVNLTGKKQKSLSAITEPVIVVAHDLSPSDTAQMDKEKVLAFATDIGGRTSHTSIVARALEIPAVVGLEDISSHIKDGDTIIVDGMTGSVIVRPSESLIDVYETKREQYVSYEQALLHYKDLPAETKDGHRVTLTGNMELDTEVDGLIDHGAEGIGLYRSEFLYMGRKDLPTEIEHMEAYKRVAEKTAPHGVVVRTLDIGGDKFPAYMKGVDVDDEINPALGLRAIRFSLKHREIFKTQMRGILMASAFGKIKILFPMISGIEELRMAKQVLFEAKGELTSAGMDFDHDIKIGAMIEVPSAAIVADHLAKEVDFFSIGTNDLLQYTIAIDRVNEHVAYLYQPFHPAVLRTIKSVVDAAHKENIPVSVCGEMAGEPELVSIFLGLGVDQLSMNSFALLRVKRLIRSIEFADVKDLSRKVLDFMTAKEVENYVSGFLKDFYKDEFWV